MTSERIDMGSVTVLRIDGDVDEDGVNVLRKDLLGCLLEGRGKVVLNLSGLKFISYMGVGVLVERLRQLRAMNGDLKLVGVNLYTQRLFRMVGVRNVFETFDTESQAIQVFQEAA